MNRIKDLLKFAIPYKKYMVLNIICNLFYALFSALSFVALIPMLKVLFQETERIQTKPEYTHLGNLQEFAFDTLNYEISKRIEENHFEVLLYSIGLILSLFFLKNLFNFLALYFITFLRNGILRDLRTSLYSKIISQPISYYSEKKKGDTLSRISTDVSEVQHSFLSMIEVYVREPLTIIFTLAVMISLNAKLTLFVFTFIPISGLIISKIGKSLKKHSNLVQEEQSNILTLVEETLSGLSIIKIFDAEKRFKAKFSKLANNFLSNSNKLINRQNLGSPVSEFLGITAIGGLLLFGGKLVLINHSIEATTFLAFIALAYNILTPAKAISKASYVLKRGNAAAQRIFEIIDEYNIFENEKNKKQLDSFKNELKFNKIHFTYDETPIFKDFSLVIPKGKTVAIVGHSGSGKSTLVKLINRFYDVQKGSITLDGNDIKNLDKTSVRKHLAMVTQDSILFNDTILQNLLLGKPDATQDEIIEATKIANAHDFIMQLPNQYDTSIGDQGGKLSGGQKQRLTIARAILKNPEILILDEATSSLDTESERLIQKALENVMKKQTTIVIAHRLTTIQNADTIVVLDKGNIVEQGTHDELLKNNKVYKSLVYAQSL